MKSDIFSSFLVVLSIVLAYAAYTTHTELEKEKYIAEEYRKALLSCEDESVVDKIIDKIRKEP